jgi:uncharacterized protein YdaU (DUF1376 family)
MSADLTRFDFNAHDFLNSETVEVMSDAEVGQYILLLCKAWLMAKDASLPNEPALLSRWAHCEKVSKKVLEKFPVVETQWGQRLRNDRLFAEWQKTIERSETKRDAANARWENASTGASTGAYADASVLHMPKPNQTNPNQSSQTKSSSGHETGDFKTIAVLFRRLGCGTPSHDRQTKKQYDELCQQYGESAVLKALEEWAEANKWRDNLSLYFFFKDAGELISEAAEAETPTSVSEPAYTTGHTLTEAIVTEKLKELAQDKADIAELAKTPDQF